MLLLTTRGGARYRKLPEGTITPLRQAQPQTGNRRPDTGARCSGQGESPGDVWALLSIRTPHCDERLGTS